MTEWTAAADAPSVLSGAELDASAAARDGALAFLREELRLIRPTLPATWADDAKFRSDLGLDSLDLVELVARAEQRFERYIGDEDLPSLVSLAAMADYLCRRPAP